MNKISFKYEIQNSYNINMRSYNDEAAREFAKNHKEKEHKVGTCRECYKKKILTVDIQGREFCNKCWELKRLEFVKKSGGINWHKK